MTNPAETNLSGPQRSETALSATDAPLNPPSGERGELVEMLDDVQQALASIASAPCYDTRVDSQTLSMVLGMVDDARTMVNAVVAIAAPSPPTIEREGLAAPKLSEAAHRSIEQMVDAASAAPDLRGALVGGLPSYDTHEFRARLAGLEPPFVVTHYGKPRFLVLDAKADQIIASLALLGGGGGGNMASRNSVTATPSALPADVSETGKEG